MGGTDINFTASIVSGAPTTYKWAVDSLGYFDDGSDGNNLAKIAFSTGASHTVYLSAVDGVGNICQGESEVVFVKLGAPVWTEIAPLLQLNSIAFLILIFCARIIILRL